MKRQTLAGTLMLLVIVLLAAASGLDAPVVSAGSFVSRQEIRQQHQQSNDPALSSLTVTVNGTAQPLSPAFSSTVKYYTVVVDAAVTQITVAGAAPVGDSVAYQETNGTAIDDADTNTNGHQVDIPPAGKRVNIVVTRTASGATTTYGLLVIHEGPAAADTVALMALYNSAGGENWMAKANWGTAEPIGMWSGVTTDGNGRVTVLSLYRNQLSGTISDLSDLTSLTSLWLGGNALTGNIPASLNSLTNLLNLSMWGNQLTGKIPALSNLTSLTLLDLGKNALTEEIPDLNSLTNLVELYLWGNQLSGPIPDLSGLTSLQYLSLSQNKLTGPIPDLSSLGNVIQLYLWDNKLSGPIPDLSALTSLKELSLAQNQLTGVIPESLNRLVSSTFLNLSFNELEGEIPELVSLTNLVTLALGGNQLTGEIPPSLNTLTTLRNLYLWRNKLTGEIPDLSSLTLMLELDLHKNELTGPVPTWLNDFAAMQGLWLNDNKLMGTIPDLSNLQALYTVELSNNDLSGSIPPSLGTLKELQNLILNDNRLTGQIPDLSGLESLAQLDMAGNQLTGPIPASLGQITGLQELYLQGNLLTGEIPAVLAELASLKAARFANDALTGCVPHGLRFLLDADEVVEGKPVHDFIAVDANDDGDTDDEDDVPQLHLPFCMLLTLWFSDASFAFAPGTTAYTTEIRVASTMVTLAQNEPTDQVSIMKGGSSYGIDEAVPLDIGPNLFTIEVTPSDARLLPQTYTVEVLHDGKVESDRDALIALYNKTGGSGWTDNANWNSDLDLDTWFGVYTDNDGRVVEINLSENNLSGTLPAQLAMFTKLEGLILTDNQLTGAIPIELSQLSELATIDLSENSFSGAIPPELANLAPMVYLDLSANRFSGTIPPELGSLTELLTLNLGDNRLSGTIPPELGAVSSMYALHLNDNQLSGTIPPELGGLIHLDFLSLQNNELSGKIPEALVDIGSTPASDGSVGLRFARFANDRLTGCVPYGLRYLLNKSDLDVGIGVDVPAHDFTRDYDGDGDYDDEYDTEGLSLPFCGLSDLTLSGLTLEPAFSASVEAYTASAAHSVTSTTVSASLNPPISGLRTDELTITKGGDLYQSGASAPLDIGPNLFTIVVTSDDGTITPHTYRVTVTRPPNTPPAFDEGAPATRDVDENTGAGQRIGDPFSATDADVADTLTYSLDAASEAFFAIDSTTGQLRTKAELDHETRKTYSVTVSVSDGADESGNPSTLVDDRLDVRINVIDINEAPQITGDASPSFAENSTAPIATYTATDPDGDTLTYSLSGPDDGAFSIDAGSGQLRAGQPLDFETKNSYLVTVEVHDGADESGTPSTLVDDRLDVTINVIDINEAPQITGDAAPSFAENSSAPIATYTATDPDGDTLTYSLNGPDHGAFSIDAGSGQLRADQPLDFETRNSYRVTVEVHDGADESGNPSTDVDDRLDVTINVIDINEAPQITGDAAPSFAENSSAPISTYTATDPDGDTLTYSLSGPDDGAFSIDAGSGQLRADQPLDFETESNYRVTVEVHDGADESGTPSTDVDDRLPVTISVENVEEPGTVRLDTLTQTIQALVEVTAVLIDDDVTFDVAWQWSRSTNGRTNWDDISGATSSTFTPTQDLDAGHYIRATATYSDPHGLSKTVQAVSPRVDAAPPDNSAPAFPTTEDGRRDVLEDTLGGEFIDKPVAATDFNGDSLLYSLSGADAASFTIEPASGHIRVGPSLTLDFETRTTYRFTVSVSDRKDEFGVLDNDMVDDTVNVMITVIDVNEPPEVSGEAAPSFAEHAQAPIATYTATDPEGGTLTWTTDKSAEFWISSRGALHFATPPTYDGNPIQVTVTASDEGDKSGSLIVRVTVTDEEDEGTVTIGPPRGWNDTIFQAGLDDDDGGIADETWQWARSTNRSSWTDITTATSASYQAVPDDIGNYLQATASYRDRQGIDKTASVALTGRIEDVNTKPATNEPPVFAETSTTRSIGQGPYAGRSIGAPVRTTDPDTGDVLTYSLSGTDAALFDIDPATGQLRTKAVLDSETRTTYKVTVNVHDGYDDSYGSTSGSTDASIQVTITVTAVRTPITSGGSGSSGGGGGGPPPVPVPSDADLDWNVTLDIESLDREHDLPTGVWSDGQTVWIVDNAAAGADSLFAYELQSGERQADRELELDRRNRFSHGIWSDGELVWIADSGQDRLFVYHLESGERNEERELELTERNSDPRGIWSDGEVIYVLDSVKDALFVYNLEAGDLLAEHALDKLNRSPRGIWSDGVAIWVSDDGAKRLFAYELGDTALTRKEDLEFTFRSLLKAGNGDPRGIWSDGDVVWVVDEQDDKVYSYNIPDAIVARLSSLKLSELEIGAFSPARLDYAASAEFDQTATSVAAEATTEVATVVVQPSDTDSDPENGHQVNLETETPITITVTSGDGSRTTTYRVLVSRPSCLEGLSTEPLSAVSFVGGSVGELETCARSLDLSAFYHQLDGVWTAFFLDAPEFLSRPFRDRFAEGLSPGETLIAKRQPVAAVAQSIPGSP